MKTPLLQFLLILLPLSLVSQNTYWVSNDPSHADIVDFSSLQTAVNFAANGDTLLIYPTGILYETITLSKSLYLEGIGYEMNETLQPSLEIETYHYNAKVNINVLNTSDVSIRGLNLLGLTINNTTDAIVSFCMISNFHFNNVQFISVNACYVGGGISGWPGISSTSIVDNSTDILLNNNLYWHELQYSLYISGSCGNIYVYNNIFKSPVGANYTTIKNNIFIGGYGGTNCIVENNLFHDGPIPGYPPGNLYNVDMASVFVGYPSSNGYSFDSRYQLAPNSPGIGYGENGIDCGIFGGDFQYRLSGISDRPIISKLDVPLINYNTEMQITIGAKIISD